MFDLLLPELPTGRLPPRLARGALGALDLAFRAARVNSRPSQAVAAMWVPGMERLDFCAHAADRGLVRRTGRSHRLRLTGKVCCG